MDEDGPFPAARHELDMDEDGPFPAARRYAHA
jgi:hypothetical protein